MPATRWGEDHVCIPNVTAAFAVFCPAFFCLRYPWPRAELESKHQLTPPLPAPGTFQEDSRLPLQIAEPLCACPVSLPGLHSPERCETFYWFLHIDPAKGECALSKP